MRKIMRAHNRIIQRSLMYTILVLFSFSRVQWKSHSINIYIALKISFLIPSFYVVLLHMCAILMSAILSAEQQSKTFHVPFIPIIVLHDTQFLPLAGYIQLL